MAIRDKVTVRFKNGGKPFVYEVNRPGGEVGYVWRAEGVVQIHEQTRKARIVRQAAFSGDEVKSVEFEPAK
jgi:hypothetical protein